MSKMCQQQACATDNYEVAGKGHWNFHHNLIRLLGSQPCLLIYLL